MKDKRLWDMRIRAERDTGISGDAFRLVSRLVSECYSNPHMDADEAFPVPISKVAFLCGYPRTKAHKAYSYTWKGKKFHVAAGKPQKFDPETCAQILYELLPTPGVSYGPHRKSYLRRADAIHGSNQAPAVKWFKFNL